MTRYEKKLKDCHQAYDGASTMLGKKSGVSTLILYENPLALVTNCQGHSLQLDVKEMSKNVSSLAAAQDTANEVKYN